MTNPTIKCENIHEFWRGFRPSEGSSFPTVILLHGSEGSMSGWIYKQAMFLAAHGYLAIPFGYSKDSTFWDAGSIREVELSETSNALSAIRKHPFC